MTETKRHSPSEETIQSIHVHEHNLQCKVDSVPSQKSGAAVGARGCIEMVERGDGIKLIWQHSLKKVFPISLNYFILLSWPVQLKNAKRNQSF